MATVILDARFILLEALFASFCINVKYLLPLPGFKVEVSRVSTEMAL